MLVFIYTLQLQHVPFLHNTMSTTLEISNLIKLFLKRDAMLDKLHHELAAQYPGFCTLCRKKWTVRGSSPRSIVDNWVPLQKVSEQSFEARALQPVLRERIISLEAQMQSFDYYYGVKILENILRHSDNLSKAIKKKTAEK